MCNVEGRCASVIQLRGVCDKLYMAPTFACGRLFLSNSLVYIVGNCPSHHMDSKVR